MAKYLLVYHGGGMPETEEERGRLMGAWEKWFQGLGGAIVDPGNPVSQIKTIGNGGAPQAGGGAPISGYSVIQADSLDKAVELSKDCPVLGGGASIEVCETFDAM